MPWPGPPHVAQPAQPFQNRQSRRSPSGRPPAHLRHSRGRAVSSSRRAGWGASRGNRTGTRTRRASSVAPWWRPRPAPQGPGPPPLPRPPRRRPRRRCGPLEDDVEAGFHVVGVELLVLLVLVLVVGSGGGLGLGLGLGGARLRALLALLDLVVLENVLIFDGVVVLESVLVLAERLEVLFVGPQAPLPRTLPRCLRLRPWSASCRPLAGGSIPGRARYFGGALVGTDWPGTAAGP